MYGSTLESRKRKHGEITPPGEEHRDTDHGKDEASQPSPLKKAKSTLKTTKSKGHTEKSAERVYTPGEVQAFSAGLQNLTDWDDDELEEKYLKLIQWFDRDNVRGEQARKRWTAEGYRAKKEALISYAALNKFYNERAARFYEKKGLVWIPLGKRQQPKAKKDEVSGKPEAIPTSKSKAKKAVDAATYSPEAPRPLERKNAISTKGMTPEPVVEEDMKLRHLFSQLVAPVTVVANFGAKQKL